MQELILPHRLPAPNASRHFFTPKPQWNRLRPIGDQTRYPRKMVYTEEVAQREREKSERFLQSLIDLGEGPPKPECPYPRDRRPRRPRKI